MQSLHDCRMKRDMKRTTVYLILSLAAGGSFTDMFVGD